MVRDRHTIIQDLMRRKFTGERKGGGREREKEGGKKTVTCLLRESRSRWGLSFKGTGNKYFFII